MFLQAFVSVGAVMNSLVHFACLRLRKHYFVDDVQKLSTKVCSGV